ncbi:bifunctional tetrahydrofolate synthase/dihydrofolate synthase [Candidatus Erwinia haradaeae]|uniref:Dihydrofolate synthase/folylpolyglutamate synthase n=1 Tax=Candidatus Erwinia haradaeae TaxID=1922217 RepID=A0A451D456_9GAMM|nr:bifunctional tetrahydrofolate synthase/dihydrofolate synthase [Candidatus Erwinia haradaeae]VFP80491.1 Dihydrofolate synthase/folylpolyglutamate synthase [Candidatus Erwinia haradaeae]
MKIKSTLSEWLHHIQNLHAQPIDLGIERVRHVAMVLNLLTPASIIFTVAGTNGKGTTCRAIELILLASGYQVGVYNSPHLMHYNERIRIRGREVTEEELITSFSVVDMGRKNISLTYFEFGTLSALWLFREAKLDIVILEVGLGGRLDATNIVDADIAIITSIALDHTTWLGSDRESIGREKAGIFRTGKPAVVGDPGMPNSIRKVAQYIGAKLHQRNRDWSYSVTGNSWEFEDVNGKISFIPLPKIPIDNAATAIAAVRISPIKVHDAMIRDILPQAALPGRFQIVSKSPWVILDVAHNPHAAHYLSKQLKKIKQYAKIHAIVGMRQDKDISNTLNYLVPQIDYWYCASLTQPRGSSAVHIMSYLKKAMCFKSVSNAWHYALENANSRDIIIVFGSFYTVSEVMTARLATYTSIF